MFSNIFVQKGVNPNSLLAALPPRDLTSGTKLWDLAASPEQDGGALWADEEKVGPATATISTPAATTSTPTATTR